MHLLQRFPLLARITLPRGRSSGVAPLLPTLPLSNHLWTIICFSFQPPSTILAVSAPLPTASFTAPTLLIPPSDTYSHCHLSSNTETLITCATGLLLLSDSFLLLLLLLMLSAAPLSRRWYGATYHNHTPASGLSSSSAFILVVHTSVAIASLTPLLYLILATVPSSDISQQWCCGLSRRRDFKPCHSSITY
jgi:hypothetical protein